MNWTQLMCAERLREYHKKGPSSDLRTEFEKDYHRIISSPSFRRLQDKTQVFPLDKSDFIRTRLTHSLEVSSFAKSLGQSVGARIIKEGLADDFDEGRKADICDVLQCAGLLHDIGNPAFGHFGESAIQDWFKSNLKELEFNGQSLTDILSEQMQNDFYNFEGNTQALRVVTKLHFLVDERGMNLTKALLATMIKYPGSSLEINYDKKDPDRDIRHKKMGYFYADRDNFEDIERSCGLDGHRHPLTFLLEAADDIAYNTADIEDAIKKGRITYEALREELEGFRKETDKVYSDMLEKLDKYHRRAKENNYEPAGNYAVSNWIVMVQGLLINAAADAFIKNYDDIMSGNCKRDLISLSRGGRIVDALSDIAYRYVFTSKPILKLEVAASAIFDFLLDKYTDAFIYYDTPYWEEKSTAIREKLTMLMSDNYLRIYKKYSDGADEAEKLYLRLLMVTDYVCGMTDSFAKMTYQELNGIQ
jgi:dGTPase